MLSGISIWQLLILLAIVVMVFGTKRLRGIGGDLGSALRDFRSAMKQGEDDDKDKDKSGTEARSDHGEHRVIDQEDEATTQHSEKTASEDRTH